MPSVSPRQHAFFEAVAHDPAFARRVGVPVSVGQDFAHADEGLRSAFADGGSVPSVLQSLPPDLLAQLQQLGSSGSVSRDGVTYAPIGVSTNDEGGTSFTPNGYTAFTDGTALTPGAKGLEYGLDGSGGALPYTVSDGSSVKEMLQGVGKDALHVITPMVALYAMALGGEGLMGAMGGAAGGTGAGLAEGAGSYLSPAEMDTALASQTAGGGGVLGAGGAAAGTGTVFNPAVDSQLASSELGLTASDVTAGGIPSVGTAGNVPFDFGAASDVPSTFNAAKDSQLASDQLGLTAADTSSATIPSVGGPGNTPYSPSQWGGNWASGMSASDIAKVVSAVTSAVGGGSGTGTGSTPGGTTGGGGYQSHEIDPGYTLVTPGWRSGRPLYVPGKDAIPDGWFGAGYTSN